MPLLIYQVDAFTAVPFRGNPAAVCILPAARDEAWMRDVAREMNLAETAFLVTHTGEPATHDAFDLRWFTPAVEVDLCGHATLASAHVLWETDRVATTAWCHGHESRDHTRPRFRVEIFRTGGGDR